MSGANLTEYQARQRPLDELRSKVEVLHNNAYRAGVRFGLAQLEQSTKAAREEGIVIGEARAMRGQIAAAAIWVSIGIVFAIIGGPVVAGWLL